MRVVIFIILIIALLLVGYYQQHSQPLPSQPDPKPSEIINLPEEMKGRIVTQPGTTAPDGETTTPAIAAEPADAAPVAPAQEIPSLMPEDHSPASPVTNDVPVETHEWQTPSQPAANASSAENPTESETQTEKEMPLAPLPDNAHSGSDPALRVIEEQLEQPPLP